HVIFRPSFVFGKDGGVLPTFVRLARFAPVTPIVGPGTQRLQPIWVEDVAEYYSRSLELPEAAGRTFEIGGPDAPTWNEFWDHLKRVLGSRRPSVHVPFAAMRVLAALTERLPGAPVTRDQLTMLALGDNVVTTSDAVETCRLALVPLDEQLRRAARRPPPVLEQPTRPAPPAPCGRRRPTDGRAALRHVRLPHDRARGLRRQGAGGTAGRAGLPARVRLLDRRGRGALGDAGAGRLR